MHEYRPRVGFKYIQNLSSEEVPGSGFEELRLNESKEIWRVAKDMHNALRTTQAIIENLNFVLYQYGELAASNLAD